MTSISQAENLAFFSIWGGIQVGTLWILCYSEINWSSLCDLCPTTGI